MKRDIKSILSVSLPAMDQPSTSILSTSLDVSLVYVRVDDVVSDDADDDSFPFTEGIPSNMFCWSEATIRGSFYNSCMDGLLPTADVVSISWCTLVLPLT